MWTWLDAEMTSAVCKNEEGFFITCGVNNEPLFSWLADGNEPNPFEETA